MTPFGINKEMQDETYRPTPAEMRMSQSINFLVGCMMRGELAGIGLAAINNEGEHSCFYYNKAQVGVLGPPLEQLRVMFETNQSFRELDNTPVNNKSYRSH